MSCSRLVSPWVQPKVRVSSALRREVAETAYCRLVEQVPALKIEEKEVV
jgi:hypothetical protein